MSRRNSFLSLLILVTSYLIGLFFSISEATCSNCWHKQYDTSDPRIFFSSQPYHHSLLGKGIPLFNLSSQANPKLMLLSILYATSVFVSYQKISKAKILRIHIQVFSGIFLLVNTNPLLVHHTTIMMYTLVRTFGV